MYSRNNLQVNWINWAVFFLTIIGLLVLYVTYLWWMALIIAGVVILLRILGVVFKKKWLQNLVYFLILAAIIGGGFMEGNRIVMFGSILGLLAMWNLDFLLVDLQSKHYVESKGTLDRKYLVVLLWISFSSLLLMVFSSSIQMDFGFGVILLLGIVLVFSLSRLLRIRRRSTD